MSNKIYRHILMPEGKDKIGGIIYMFATDVLDPDQTAKDEIEKHKTNSAYPAINEYEGF